MQHSIVMSCVPTPCHLPSQSLELHAGPGSPACPGDCSHAGIASCAPPHPSCLAVSHRCCKTGWSSHRRRAGARHCRFDNAIRALCCCHSQPGFQPGRRRRPSAQTAQHAGAAHARRAGAPAEQRRAAVASAAQEVHVAQRLSSLGLQARWCAATLLRSRTPSMLCPLQSCTCHVRHICRNLLMAQQHASRARALHAPKLRPCGSVFTRTAAPTEAMHTCMHARQCLPTA